MIWLCVSAIYMMTVMIMTALCLFFTVAIMNIHYHPPARPIPAWLRSVVFGYMAPLICWKLPCTPHETDRENHRNVAISPVHTPDYINGTTYNNRPNVAQWSIDRKFESWKNLLCILERILFYIFLLIGVVNLLIFLFG